MSYSQEVSLMFVRTMPAHLSADRRISEVAVELVGIIQSDKERCSEL